MRVTDDGNYVLSTGKTLPGEDGMFSITSDHSFIGSGYDNRIWREGCDYDLTPGELVEIADFMIAQWRIFRSKMEKTVWLANAGKKRLP